MMAAAFGGARRIVATAALAALAACSHQAAQGPGASGPGAVGYVRMEELVHKHPLYDQLARYDRSIDAFDLAATAPKAVAADPRLAERDRALQQQLLDAAGRTKALINEKQHQYAQEEAAAIAAALRGAGVAGPSAGQIAGSVDVTARQQQRAVAGQAQHDLDAYRVALQKQDQAQINAAQRALSDRADRSYRAKAEELQSKESALSLKLASEDASQRLALRTKLSSLALDDAAREDAQKQLAALDRKEADAVAAERNRDAQTLAVLQGTLKTRVQKDLNAQVGAIQRRSAGSFAQRQSALARQVGTFSGGAVRPTTGGQQVSANLPPALRSRIEQLHSDYQKRFEDDAKTTIADYEKTRADLSRRYRELHGIDAASQQGGQAQIMSLRKKRDDLYVEITAQINREVRLIAQQRGISVVLSDVVAPAGGVDLTPDALKDIESLHE
jgi:outer membrane OmpH-like protein